MGCCEKCCKVTAGILVVIGLLWLLGELGMVTVLPAGVTWWPIVFIVFGVICFMGSKCPACQAKA